MNTATRPAPADILDALGYGDMTMPVASFNDDDWYLVNPMTREIKAQFSSRSKWLADREANGGLSVYRGLMAKNMGLWRLPAGARSAA